jgi:hypothetical protein
MRRKLGRLLFPTLHGLKRSLTLAPPVQVLQWLKAK